MRKQMTETSVLTKHFLDIRSQTIVPWHRKQTRSLPLTPLVTSLAKTVEPKTNVFLATVRIPVHLEESSLAGRIRNMYPREVKIRKNAPVGKDIPSAVQRRPISRNASGEVMAIHIQMVATATASAMKARSDSCPTRGVVGPLKATSTNVVEATSFSAVNLRNGMQLAMAVAGPNVANPANTESRNSYARMMCVRPPLKKVIAAPYQRH